MPEFNYPSDIAEAEVANTFMRFDVLERVSARSHTHAAGINIYMPETIANQQVANYDGQSLGRGAFGENITDDVTKTLINSYENVVTSMQSKLHGGGGTASAQDKNAYKSKKVINPFMKMLFRSVGFRNFEFSFKFTPKSVADCTTIQSTVNTFRKSMLPTGDYHQSAKLGYPNEFEITAKYNGGDHPFLPKYKRCVLTNCTVNYAGAGMYSTMANGFPTETHMVLQFSEIELLSQSDISLTGSTY